MHDHGLDQLRLIKVRFSGSLAASQMAESSRSRRIVDATRVEKVPSPENRALWAERMQRDGSRPEANDGQPLARGESDSREFVHSAEAVLAPRSRKHLHRIPAEDRLCR